MRSCSGLPAGHPCDRPPLRGGGRRRRVERDRDGVVAERLRHPGEHRPGVVGRAGGEVALRRGGVELGRRHGVQLAVVLRLVADRVLHALHQAPLPADDPGLRRVQHGRGERGRRQVDRGLLAVRRGGDGAGAEAGEVDAGVDRAGGEQRGPLAVQHAGQA